MNINHDNLGRFAAKAGGNVASKKTESLSGRLAAHTKEKSMQQKQLLDHLMNISSGSNLIEPDIIASLKMDLHEGTQVFSDQARAQIAKNVNQIHIMTESQLQRNAKEFHVDKDTIAFYSPSKKTAVFGSTYPPTVAHELSHALDRKGMNTGEKMIGIMGRYSDSPTWQKAWKYEIVDSDSLMRDYAKQNRVEGFACAIEYAHEHGTERLRKNSPGVYQYLVKHNLIKEDS